MRPTILRASRPPSLPALRQTRSTSRRVLTSSRGSGSFTVPLAWCSQYCQLHPFRYQLLRVLPPPLIRETYYGNGSAADPLSSIRHSAFTTRITARPCPNRKVEQAIGPSHCEPSQNPYQRGCTAGATSVITSSNYAWARSLAIK